MTMSTSPTLTMAITKSTMVTKTTTKSTMVKIVTMATMMVTMVMVQSSWRDEGVIFEARGSCNVPADLADKSPPLPPLPHKITGRVT